MSRHRRWVAILTLILIGLSCGATTSAKASPGDGTRTGIWLPSDYMGNYRIGGNYGYCIDPNGGPSEPVSGWVEIAPSGQHKQTGLKHSLGRVANTGPEISSKEWGEIAYILHIARDRRDDTMWAAVTDRLVRLRSVFDSAQMAAEEQRFAELLQKYPQARAISDSLNVEATRFAGPYTLDLSWKKQPTATEPGSASVQLRAVSGEKAPFEISVKVDGLSAKINEGLITVPAGVGKHHISAAVTVAASVPTLRIPARYDQNHSDSRGQRMVSDSAPAQLNAALEYEVAKIKPTLITTASTAEAQPGAALTDTVAVSQAHGYNVTGQAILWGPYSQQPTINQCQKGDPQAGSVALTITGDGTWTTEPIVVTKPGYYVWQEVMPQTDTAQAVTTPCGEVAETTLIAVKTTPQVTPVQSHIPKTAPAPAPELKTSAKQPEVVTAAQPLIRAGEGSSPFQAALWLGALVLSGSVLVVLIRRHR